MDLLGGKEVKGLWPLYSLRDVGFSLSDLVEEIAAF